MPRAVRLIGAAVVALAAVLAVAPRPSALVERLYAAAIYPRVQAVLTSAANRVPIAVFDLVLCGLVLALAWWMLEAWRERRRTSAGRAAGQLAARIAVLAASAYLWFLVAWGLNYGRPPLEVRLALPAAPPTAEDVRALLDEAVAGANAESVRAHGDGGEPYDAQADVARLLWRVEARLGRARPTVPAVPKPTLLSSYFRMAGVDGLTAPAALETLLNPDLTPFERPFTLAHEWAHLAGFAPEADASFVAWLVAMTPDAAARTRYSGWLFLLSETAAQVPAAARRAALAGLGDLPRRDLADIARRQAARVDLVERVGWRVYDSYLKSQGVHEGVRSYSRVIELVVRARRAGAGPAMPQ